MDPETVNQKAFSQETTSLTAPTLPPNSADSTPNPDESAKFMINPGSSIAALWIRTSQDTQPPVSIPCSVMPISTCPQCHHRLHLALNSSGLQNCSHCGWIG